MEALQPSEQPGRGQQSLDGGPEFGVGPDHRKGRDHQQKGQKMLHSEKAASCQLQRI